MVLLKFLSFLVKLILLLLRGEWHELLFLSYDLAKLLSSLAFIFL